MDEDAIAMSEALTRWYDCQPAVRRLWAVRPKASSDALRILLQLEPSTDGDETTPAWLAHGTAWSRELQQRLNRVVQLECVEAVFIDDRAIDDDAGVVASLFWRDSTALAA